jgi:alkylation response protein AidB-like acyl-CoA dehydrogenase
MAIAITDDHRELERVARSFLEGNGARDAARALLDTDRETLPAFWPKLVELGWLGVHVPTEYGGSGFGLPELVVVLEELGREAAPGPFLGTVAASAVVVAAGNYAQRARLLPALVDGSCIAAIGTDGTLTRTPDGRVTGNAGLLLGGDGAQLLVLVAGDDVVIIDRDAPGVQCEVPRNLDLTRRAALIALDDAVVDESRVLEGARATAVAYVRTLAAAEAAGVAQSCVHAATEYAKVRQQFGRVIGTYQAVKHHCANMLVAAELATAAVWDAARAAATGGPQFELAAAIAAAQALPAALANAQLNIQVHGGIGYTWEHDAHLYLRRAGALLALFGTDSPDTITRLTNDGVSRSLGIDLPAEAEALRAEVRAFAERVRSLPPAEQRRAFIETGYVQPHWPQPWGRAASALEQLVIEEELTGAARPNYGIGTWIMLTLIGAADADQIARWIRPSLEGEYRWCQLFSEPEAGSDAAGIRTRGTRTDGGWLVNGQKVWTSGAQECNRGFATVRTNPDAPKHAGITMMVIDMHAPGVDVRPLREATGGAMFSEVFFDDVFVADDDVVGPVDGGWTVARSTLGNERVSIGSGAFTFPGADLTEMAKAAAAGSYASVAVGRLLAERQTIRSLNLRSATRAIVGGEPGPEGNVSKLLTAEHVQRVTDLALELVGPAAALAEAGSPADALVFTRCLTIAGGTSEITRNQIGDRILGLPRDPLTT